MPARERAGCTPRGEREWSARDDGLAARRHVACGRAPAGDRKGRGTLRPRVLSRTPEATNGNEGPSPGPWLAPFVRHGFRNSKTPTAPKFRRCAKVPAARENHCTSRRGSHSVVVVYHIPQTIDQPYCDENCSMNGLWKFPTHRP